MEPHEMDGAPTQTEALGRDWFKLAVGVIAVIAVVVLAIEGMAWYKGRQLDEAAPAPPPLASLPAPAPAEDSAPAHPLPETEPAAPPTLQASDAPLMAALVQLTGAADLARWLRPAGLARHLVATIDALPRRQVPQQALPTTAVPGKLVLATDKDGARVIAADNARRYQPWIHLLQGADPQATARLYRQFYPVLQQAYRELGYPKKYFNDRLVEVIDDLLLAPEDPGALRVEAPAVMWKYSDPELEALSAGQKVLLRMGPANARIVHAWLSAFRAQIA
jgi:hypothetical protein